MTGVFISFEGVDGVGKTTQVKHLRAHVRSLGRTAVVTREPGGTVLGRSIRRLLLHGVADDAGRADAASHDAPRTEATADIAPRAEALLFAADRAQHVAEVIRPALERGDVVITDRYLDSSLAYQAGGRELTAGEIRDLSMWATGGLLPDRTYLLDMDPARSHARLTHAADRMESAGNGFQERTRRAFLDLAAAEPGRFRVIDAARPVNEVWADVRADFDALVADAARTAAPRAAEREARP
ncbi:dTMP kinase [Bifidobacterium moraviense]|nr:dTMP kinase [Bifidobacterium sp. DSM 109958]